jgi:hypothetical protein
MKKPMLPPGSAPQDLSNKWSVNLLGIFCVLPRPWWQKSLSVLEELKNATLLQMK